MSLEGRNTETFYITCSKNNVFVLSISKLLGKVFFYSKNFLFIKKGLNSELFLDNLHYQLLEMSRRKLLENIFNI